MTWCYLWGHSWNWDLMTITEEGKAVQVARCQRCGKSRIAWL